MPPVEATSFPAVLAAFPPVKDLKVVDKAMLLPVVSDAVSEVSKYAHIIGENSHVQHAKQLMEDCLKGISENERVVSMKEAVLLPLSSKHLTTVKETVLPRLTAVKDSMLPHVAGAVETLDNMACGGLDQLKTAVPSLTSPTPELMETAKEAASGYLSLLAEYIASFSVAQLSLNMADRGLVHMEAAAARVLLPEATIPTYLRTIRRSVRAVRRAGARRNHLHGDELSRSGLAGRVASILHLNALFALLGLQLIPASRRKSSAERRLTIVENEEEAADLPEARMEDLHGDLSAYRSEDDPDFVGSGDSSSSSSNSEANNTKDDVRSCSSSSSESECEEEAEKKAETAEKTADKTAENWEDA